MILEGFFELTIESVFVKGVEKVLVSALRLCD